MKATSSSIFGRPPKLFKPGTAIWLMRHHIRTRLRGKPAQNPILTVARNLVMLAMLVFGCVTLGGSIANALAVLDGNYDYQPYVLKAGIILTAFVISLLGSSIMSAYSMFTDRDDLDLLLASPLPPQRILLSRLLQSAYGAFFSSFLMGTLAFGYSIVTVDVRFALIYPVLMSFMLIDLAISFAIARCLLIWFGLRRGRTIAMVIGFIILICGVMSFQINSMIGTRTGDALLAEFFGPTFTAQFTAFLTPIGQLAFGQIPQTLFLVVCAVTTFFGVGAFFWNLFAGDTAFMAGQAQHVARTGRVTKLRFGKGLVFTTIVKEWRSMLRDPFVLVQVATPLISLIPMSIAVWSLQRTETRFDPSFLNAIIGFLVVQFGGGIAGTLAWTAASIEEAGDLLLSSPADGKKLFWSKALATAIPSFAFLALAMICVAMNNPVSGLLGLIIGAIGLACVGAVEFLRPRPARRAKMTQRQDRSIVSIIMGMVFSLIWAVATAMAIKGLGLWTLIPISIGTAAMAFVWATAPKSVVWMARAPKVGAAGGPWKA
jgi:ABC-2 type transport system permease protein